MPIHEFACSACEQQFEELILRESDEAEVGCPACASKDVSRLISRPAAARTGGAGGSASRAAPVG